MAGKRWERDSLRRRCRRPGRAERFLVDVGHLPAALLRLCVIPVLPTALCRVLLPWLVRQGALQFASVSTGARPGRPARAWTHLSRRHHLLRLGPLRLLRSRVVIVEASIGAAVFLPGGRRPRRGENAVCAVHVAGGKHRTCCHRSGAREACKCGLRPRALVDLLCVDTP